MLPVNDLDSLVLFHQTKAIMQIIKNSGGNLIAILCDNNRVNQAFFKMFDCIKPWLTKDNIFLLFDFVHLIKSIRNNWITQKTQQLSFQDGDVKKIAKWSDLIQLYNLEKDHTVKLSKLSDVAIFPKPVERQSVHMLTGIL